MRLVTLCLYIKDGAVLLGMKKKAFGVGFWNGFGGKVEEGETIEQAVVREMEEESGIRIAETALAKAAVLDFRFLEHPEWNQQMYVYLAREGSGEPRESDEMEPKWFALDAVPYERMWDGDALWIPQVLRGECVEGEIVFAGEGKVSSHTLQPATFA